MKKIVTLGMLAFLVVLAFGCGKVVDDQEKPGHLATFYSNGKAGVSYFYNDRFVHEKNYGQVLDGIYREGLVACTFSERENRLSIDMYLPEEQDLGGFAGSSEGLFLDFYDFGIPKTGDYVVLPNGRSKITAVLPQKIIPQIHNFGVSSASSRCDLRFNSDSAKLTGSVDCNDLVSHQVSGKVTVRASFECETVTKY